MPSLHLPPTFNLTRLPSSFPAPVLPDSYVCDPFYTLPQPATLADCREAFNLLPEGAPQPFSYHFKDDDPNRLPITVGHGTCDIIFQTSGEEARAEDPIVIDPTDIRNMAGWIIDQCVANTDPDRKGGAVTKYLKRATDWVLDPNADFYHDVFPAASTYYSLHVWNHGPDNPRWNPGNSDPEIFVDVRSWLRGQADHLPAGPEKNEIEGRVADTATWISQLDYENLGYHWWGYNAAPPVATT